jgi:hypothetical protein
MVPIEQLELGLLRTIAHVLIPDPELSQLVWDLCDKKRGIVKQIDVLALRAEALLYMPGSEDWAGDFSNEGVKTSAIDPRVWPAMVAPRISQSWSRCAWLMWESGPDAGQLPFLEENIRRALLGR